MPTTRVLYHSLTALLHDYESLSITLYEHIITLYDDQIYVERHKMDMENRNEKIRKIHLIKKLTKRA